MTHERLSVLGVPSSAGAYAPGQEDAPRALRDVGLLRLLESGPPRTVRDLGDLSRFRWRPDRQHRRAQNVDQVIATARRVMEAVRSPLESGDSLLVIGGDCTVEIGVIAGCVAAGFDPGLVYLDMHADLNTPSSVIDGALDWMGVSHLLGIDGCVEALGRIGTRYPLLRPEDVVVIGLEDSQGTEWERDVISRVGLHTISAERVRSDPTAAAAAALEALAATADPLVIHFDVDVIDFVDAPLSENTGRNVGVTLEQALAAVGELAKDHRARVLTLAELNPGHASADPEALDRFIAGLARTASRL
jgi:arginase